MSDAGGALRLASEYAAETFLRLLCGVSVTGLERIPRHGPLIVACNHVSLVDPPLLGSAIAPARRPRFLAKKELFANPLMAAFFRSTGVLQLDRGSADHAAMRAALDALESGGSLAIFPEGTRVRPGERRAPKPGVSFLSARARAPVLPARVVGTDAFPRRRLEVRFGEPLAAAREAKTHAAAYASAVMDAIYSL